MITISIEDMKETFTNLKLIRRDKITKPAIWLCFLIIFSGFSILIYQFSRLPPEVPLFYSRSWGEEQLARREFLFLLPSFSLIVLILNLFAAGRIFSKEKLLAQILLWSAAVFSLLAAITLLKIIILVI